MKTATTTTEAKDIKVNFQEMTKMKHIVKIWVSQNGSYVPGTELNIQLRLSLHIENQPNIF